MEIVGAAVMVVGTFGAALAAVAVVRRRPLLLAAPLALAVLVVFEALLLDGLSLLRAVSAPALYAAHAAAILAGAAVAWRRGLRPSDAPALARRSVAAVRALGWPALLVVPIGLLAAVSAVRYLPNNWDSMTYHLGRVAHWLQHRSVEPYPTHVVRQVISQPGAEYVLTALQGMAGSDRLANLLQLACWGLAVLAAPGLARLAGAPRRLAPWAAVLVAALPMGVLQASTTQNDLVAAAMTLAIVAGTTPFLHRAPRWRTADAVLLGIALAAGALVKATALVAAGPFLLFALVRVVLATPRRPASVAMTVALVVAVAAGPIAPEVIRRARPEYATALASNTAAYTYAGVLDLGDRALNLGRGLVRHVPSPRPVVEAVGIRDWCLQGEGLCGTVLSRAQEDYAGNPVHLVLAGLAAGLVVARWRRLPRRGRVFLCATAAAWVLFHLTFRDNNWISRLETPTYVLAGLAVAAWGRQPAPGGEGRRRRSPPGPAGRAPLVATAIVASVALAWGARAALDNEFRPPFPHDERPQQLGYYASPFQWDTARRHAVALAAAGQLRCGRIGLYLGEDSYDYPLTWRAMQQGLEVRHVFGADPWPCLVFSDRPKPPAPLEALGWRRTAVPFLFLNDGGGAAIAAPAPASHGG